jgi:hypothetical protein
MWRLISILVTKELLLSNENSGYGVCLEKCPMTEFFIIGERFVAITRQAAACC